ncbi:MAG: hypothetical protein ACLSWP_12580 [Terrisporobacter sp.]
MVAPLVSTAAPLLLVVHIVTKCTIIRRYFLSGDVVTVESVQVPVH